MVYTPKDLVSQAQRLANLLAPAEVRIVSRSPSTVGGIAVIVGSAFSGQIVSVPKEASQSLRLQKNTTFDRGSWRQIARSTRMQVLMPTVWAAGFTYDMFRAYRVKIAHGKTVAAVVAVINAPASVDPNQGAFDIQEIHWTKAPILAKPTHTLVVKGRRYKLYFSGDKLTMVAWTIGGNAYWVTNTIDKAIPNSFIIALATSFKPVK